VDAGHALVFAQIDGQNDARGRRLVVVFMLQAPRGGVGFVRVVTFRLPRSHGLHGFFRC
jgi:hypothetical protein